MVDVRSVFGRCRWPRSNSMWDHIMTAPLIFEITVTVARTTNIGDFESVRNEICLKSTVPPGMDAQSSGDSLYKKAETMLVDQVGAAIKRFKRKT